MRSLRCDDKQLRFTFITLKNHDKRIQINLKKVNIMVSKNAYCDACMNRELSNVCKACEYKKSDNVPTNFVFNVPSDEGFNYEI